MNRKLRVLNCHESRIAHSLPHSHTIMAAFGQTLLAMKIYTRYVHFRFSVLIVSARTQPICSTRFSHILNALNTNILCTILYLRSKI